MKHHNQKIIRLGNPILRQECVDVGSPKIVPAGVVHKMKFALQVAKGVGLAANQFGRKESFFIYRNNSPMHVIFNPHITHRSQETELDMEGCLSIPGIYYPVPRAKEVTLEGLDWEGKPIKIHAEGFLARIFQHETDHLAGKLLIDYLPGVQTNDS